MESIKQVGISPAEHNNNHGHQEMHEANEERIASQLRKKMRVRPMVAVLANRVATANGMR